MSTVSLHRSAILLCITCVLAACGASDAPAPARDAMSSRDSAADGPATAANKLTACGLITKEEGADTLAEAVDDPVEQIINPGSDELAALSQCTVQATAAPGKTLSVLFRRSPIAGSNQPGSVRQTLSESGVTPEDVPGVGDEAFWGASDLHVFFAGDRYLIVTVRGLGDSEALARATEVARRAMQRARD